MPRYLTLMLLVPLGGAAEKVRVVPDTEYVLGSCSTPVMATMMDDVFAGATVIVKAVWLPVPENVSTRKAADIGAFPMYDILRNPQPCAVVVSV
jgi:hypothetical protein